jgi:hypothetical protein
VVTITTGNINVANQSKENIMRRAVKEKYMEAARRLSVLYQRVTESGYNGAFPITWVQMRAFAGQSRVSDAFLREINKQLYEYELICMYVWRDPTIYLIREYDIDNYRSVYQWLDIPGFSETEKCHLFEESYNSSMSNLDDLHRLLNMNIYLDYLSGNRMPPRN